MLMMEVPWSYESEKKWVGVDVFNPVEFLQNQHHRKFSSTFPTLQSCTPKSCIVPILMITDEFFL
jgi:hypothetical protein